MPQALFSGSKGKRGRLSGRAGWSGEPVSGRNDRLDRAGVGLAVAGLGLARLCWLGARLRLVVVATGDRFEPGLLAASAALRSELALQLRVVLAGCFERAFGHGPFQL